MSDIIRLLPDSVANQIAAGEVVQRPASVVKELLENSCDAGASKIQLLIKDAGRTLVQVIDNGCGMTTTDARMCFERHATSKIKQAEDIFRIRTMGFRGEAMASIAAVAQVELKTKLSNEDLGTLIQIDGSNVLKHEPCTTPNGTSIAVKNLFYNIPARRNFLKSDSVELKHIVEEFQHIALAHPDVHWVLNADGREIFNLPSSSLKQRIVNLLGNNFKERLVPVEEDTPIIKIKGFVGKPEFAKKSRGEQFLFVNERFIKNAYLHHAITSAYDDLLPKDSFALYVLFIDIDPKLIDVNVHPTKTEIKFDDEKTTYAILRSSIKHALGQYQISPAINFDLDENVTRIIENLDNTKEITTPKINLNPDYNPFSERKTYSNNDYKKGIPSQWETLYDINKLPDSAPFQTEINIPLQPEETSISQNGKFLQLHNKYIISQIKSGFIIIDQKLAHERILYEKILHQMESLKGLSQQCLFPKNISLSEGDAILVQDLLDEFQTIGFNIRFLNRNTIVIDGVPPDFADHNEIALFEEILDTFKNSNQALKIDKRAGIAKAIAKNTAIPYGKVLTDEAMNQLIDQLFECPSPNFSLEGKPIIITFALEEIASKFA